MARARGFAVLPWIGLVLALRLVSGPGPSTPRDEPALVARSAAASTLCATIGCGCPHEEARSECCCAPGEAPSDAPREIVARAPTTELGAGRSDDAALPRTSLTDFHCSGPKPLSSAAGASGSVAVPWMPLARSGLLGEREWSARIEPGPPFDLATEPPTPPPRLDARG